MSADDFAAALRDPKAPAPAWIAPRRLAVYRDLVRRNLDRLLAGSLPVSRQLLDEARWNALIEAFVALPGHGEPQMRRLPAVFVPWAAQQTQIALPPWWPDLSRYELTELELAQAEEIAPAAVPAAGVATEALQLSPLARCLTLDWPVHRIDAAYADAPEAPDAPGAATYLLLWRTADGRVRFRELNALTAALLARLDGRPATAVLTSFAQQQGLPVETLLAHGRALLDELLAAEALRVTA